MAKRWSESLPFRWRASAAGLLGVLAGAAAHSLGAPLGASMLAGWNVAAVLFLVPTGWVLLFDDGASVRARAGRMDESRAVMMVAVLGAVAISLGAIVQAMAEGRASKGHDPSHPSWVLALSVSTLVLSWLVVQSLFALHYAHRFFGDRDGDGTADKGLEFPGAPPDTYRDFLYVAICIGATCQVSDFDVTSARFRNLVTVHAVIAFVFNTMVLALGINIFATVMGQ